MDHIDLLKLLLARTCTRQCAFSFAIYQNLCSQRSNFRLHGLQRRTVLLEKLICFEILLSKLNDLLHCPNIFIDKLLLLLLVVLEFGCVLTVELCGRCLNFSLELAAGEY